MFLTEKHRSLLPIFSTPNRDHLSDPFDRVLSSRLFSLLPIPAPTEVLSWLSRASELLSVTIADATSLLLLHRTSSHNLSPFLDSTSLSLLDSCNSISALSDGLLRRLLFVRVSLKSHKPVVLPEKKHQLSAIRLSSSMQKPPHGEINPVQNAIYAVQALSELVIGAIWVTLSGNGKEFFEELKVDTEIFAWGREFNKVLEAASKTIGECSVDDELEKMEATIRGLKAEMDLDGEMEKQKIDGMERRSEDIREGLEKMKDSMNAVFHAALCARNAAVQSLLVGAQKKC